jgi:hypothetical protein
MIMHCQFFHIFAEYGLGFAVRIKYLKHVFIQYEVSFGLLSFAGGMYTHNKEEVHWVIVVWSHHGHTIYV